jgi:hypothetical protein
MAGFVFWHIKTRALSSKHYACMHGWVDDTDGWMHGWVDDMDGCMHGWMDAWMGGSRYDACVMDLFPDT